jgi:hypothetical protein
MPRKRKRISTLAARFDGLLNWRQENLAFRDLFFAVAYAKRELSGNKRLPGEL